VSAILVLNPRKDGSFVEFATELASRIDDAAQMQKLLRERYPAAVVRPRDLSSETAVVWYVYRDGSWTAGGAATEG
jgi:hypothetical protein